MYLSALPCLAYPVVSVDRWGTTDDLATSSLHSSRLSAFLMAAPSVNHVHSGMLSSHLFLCLPRLLPPWTVPCMTVLASPVDLVMWPYHLSFRCLTVVRRSSCGPMACRVLFRTSSLVTCSLFVMPRSFLRHLISMACILFSVSAVNVQDSQAYRNMDMTRERISLIFELSFQMVLSLASTAVAWAILAKISGLDPSSVMIAPRYLNRLTQSSFSPLTLMSVLKPLVLLVISLVYSALICMPKAVEALSLRSTKSASWSSLPARSSMSSAKTQVCDISATNADCPFMVVQCVSHNSLQEDVEEGGGEHTALSYSDGGSEPVPYAVVKVHCAGGLFIEVLYHSDQVGVDVEMLHGGP